MQPCTELCRTHFNVFTNGREAEVIDYPLCHTYNGMRAIQGAKDPLFWSIPAVWVICCERAEAPRQSGKHSIWHRNGKIVLCVWPNTRAVLTSGGQEKGTGAPHASLVYSTVLCFCTNLISIEFYWLSTPYQKPTTIFKTSAFYDLFPILNSYFILIICIFMLVMYPTRERYIPLMRKVRQ